MIQVDLAQSAEADESLTLCSDFTRRMMHLV